MVVRCMQPNDLGVACRRLRKQVRIGSHEVRELHLRLVRIPAWAQYMSYEVNGSRVIRRNRKDVDVVAIVNCKTTHLRANRFGIAGIADFEAQHRASFMRYQALDFNVPECCSGENSSRQIEYIQECLLITQLVDGGAAHHAFYRHYRTKRRDHQGVAVLESLHIPANTVEQEVVRVYFFDQL